MTRDEFFRARLIPTICPPTTAVGAELQRQQQRLRNSHGMRAAILQSATARRVAHPHDRATGEPMPVTGKRGRYIDI